MLLSSPTKDLFGGLLGKIFLYIERYSYITIQHLFGGLLGKIFLYIERYTRTSTSIIQHLFGGLLGMSCLTVLINASTLSAKKLAPLWNGDF